MLINVKGEFDVTTDMVCADYSFLNLASLSTAFDFPQQDIKYLCDGMLLSALFSILTLHKVRRFSFDFTSIADPVFRTCENNGLRVFFVGGKDAELERFIDKIKKRYPLLNISGSSDGYFTKRRREQVIEEIISSDSEVLIASLGAGIQEDFLRDVRCNGFQGVGFTSGGFIRQESSTSTNYYPVWVDVLKLRAFYRMYKEHHTIKRYLISYPVNCFRLFFYVLSSKLKIRIM
ncbi:WecB/TagA/CpsF family glycosyltransferase [Chitinibacter sp. FCG-7]|uniref:WecB/TagA/CpsF family glycosyltransferase n=1 Tax=Chitinibacter mangrovi TaxID=3153927 RepID=A0AAU7F656_9NEIS